VSGPREPFEVETAKILGGITVACLGITLVVYTVAPLVATAVPALVTMIFLIFFLWSLLRFPIG
jgi:hypothetical protein